MDSMSWEKRRRIRNDRGLTMVESLISLVLLSIIGLSVTYSAMYGVRFQRYTEIGNIAMNLALSKVEELSGIRLDLLDSSYGGTETNLTVTGYKVKFTRVTTVTTNADGSKQIDVTISANKAYLLNSVHFTTTFAPWEA